MVSHGVREIFEGILRKFLGRWMYQGGTEVLRGAYLSLYEVEFFVTSKHQHVLPGGEKDVYLKVPLIMLPALFPVLATFFMMFVPALGFVGFLYFLIRKFRKKNLSLWCLIPLCACLLSSGLAAEKKEYTEKEIKDLNRACFKCHATNKTHFKFRNGEIIQKDVLPKKYYLMDVHAKDFPCTGCHAKYTEKFHPQISQFASIKQYRLDRYYQCKPCHEEQYKGMTDGIHFKSLTAEDDTPPVCTDCHIHHKITSFKTHKQQAVETCGGCHLEVFEIYEKSIHGRELASGSNTDVPGCMDCHSPHANADPTLAKAHVASPHICKKCHADKELMDKYGLRSDVYETYLNDFHGVTNKFYEESGKEPPARIEAVCVDCHGFHDIQRVAEKDGAIDRKYVHQMCLKCHEGVPENFSSAWLSHYRPSVKHHPFVFLFTVFYWFMIPFTLGGLAIHLVAHFLRYIDHLWKHDD